MQPNQSVDSEKNNTGRLATTHKPHQVTLVILAIACGVLLVTATVFAILFFTRDSGNNLTKTKTDNIKITDQNSVTDDANDVSWKTFHSELGLSFEYPSDWKIKTSSRNMDGGYKIYTTDLVSPDGYELTLTEDSGYGGKGGVCGSDLGSDVRFHHEGDSALGPVVSFTVNDEYTIAIADYSGAYDQALSDWCQWTYGLDILKGELVAGENASSASFRSVTTTKPSDSELATVVKILSSLQLEK
jgi:hypothetical protein